VSGETIESDECSDDDDAESIIHFEHTGGKLNFNDTVNLTFYLLKAAGLLDCRVEDLIKKKSLYGSAFLDKISALFSGWGAYYVSDGKRYKMSSREVSKVCLETFARGIGSIS
jgi:hypothetical protein